jgi:hypothetical protein
MFSRATKFLLLIAAVFCFSCREPQKAELKTYLPLGTLIYLETGDLSKVGAVFTGNKYWQELSGQKAGYLSFLQNKQAALAVVGFGSSDAGTALQVRPEIALVIDTQSSEAQASAGAEKVLKELSRRFSGGEPQIEKQQRDNLSWMSAPGSDGKNIYATVLGPVILIANNENTLKLCLDVKQGRAENLVASAELAQAKEQYGAPDAIAFGFISPAGVKAVSDYLSIAYAMKSSENSLVREMISGVAPDMLQKTVESVAWSARATGTSVEDTYFIKTEKEFGGTVAQTVKPSAPTQGTQGECDPGFIPRGVFSISCYRLEDPQLAWRGALLSIGGKLDQGPRKIFEDLSQQLLKPYGIDDPELFLSAVTVPIITVRFDADGDSAAAIVKVKDKEKLKASIAQSFDVKSAGEQKDEAESWTSRDKEFIAAFAGDYLIIGNAAAVTECLRAKSGDNLAPKFSAESAGAILLTQQKDDSAMRILSEMAAEQGKTVDVMSYAVVETRVEPRGIRRKSVSAFGLFGEIFRQAIE